MLRQIDGTGFITNPQVGDFISFHWDWACDRLSPRQVQNLEKHTEYYLKLANRTL